MQLCLKISCLECCLTFALTNNWRRRVLFFLWTMPSSIIILKYCQHVRRWKPMFCSTLSTVLGWIQLSSCSTQLRRDCWSVKSIPSKWRTVWCSMCRVQLIQGVRDALTSLTENDFKDMWCFSMRKYIKTLTYGFDWVAFCLNKLVID